MYVTVPDNTFGESSVSLVLLKKCNWHFIIWAVSISGVSLGMFGDLHHFYFFNHSIWHSLHTWREFSFVFCPRREHWQHHRELEQRKNRFPQKRLSSIRSIRDIIESMTVLNSSLAGILMYICIYTLNIRTCSWLMSRITINMFEAYSLCFRFSRKIYSFLCFMYINSLKFLR